MLPSPGVLRSREVAAQQPRQVARDRQAEAGAAVLPVRAAVGLPEGLEDDHLLVLGDADAGVAHRECDTPSSSPACDAHRHLAGVGELDRVRQQVRQDLPEALHVGHDGSGVPGSTATRNPRPFSRSSGSKIERHAVDRAGQVEPLRRDLDLAGLDLRQVEDVVDQLQQVLAGRRDRLGELDLLRASGCRPCCRRAAWPGSARCSAACAARGSCWPGTRSCTGWRARAPRPWPQRRLRAQQRCPSAPRAASVCSSSWTLICSSSRLLRFQPRLRFLQRAALLLQLLVADAQLLLLGLQLLALPLRLLEQLLELRCDPWRRARRRRAPRRRDRAARARARSRCGRSPARSPPGRRRRCSPAPAAAATAWRARRPDDTVEVAGRDVGDEHGPVARGRPRRAGRRPRRLVRSRPRRRAHSRRSAGSGPRSPRGRRRRRGHRGTRRESRARARPGFRAAARPAAACSARSVRCGARSASRAPGDPCDSRNAAMTISRTSSADPPHVTRLETRDRLLPFGLASVLLAPLVRLASRRPRRGSAPSPPALRSERTMASAPAASPDR